MIAIENGFGWKYGVNSLFYAALFALTSRDRDMSLYPFMLAAATDDPSLSTIFELLRNCPEIIQIRCNAQ